MTKSQITSKSIFLTAVLAAAMLAGAGAFQQFHAASGETAPSPEAAPVGQATSAASAQAKPEGAKPEDGKPEDAQAQAEEPRYLCDGRPVRRSSPWTR